MDLATELLRTVNLAELTALVDRHFDQTLGLSGLEAHQVEATGYLLGEGFSNADKTAPHHNFWTLIKTEAHLLICTEEPRYEPLRRQIVRHAGEGQTALLTRIAAGIGFSLDIEAPKLVPFVALTLIVLLKLGRDAYCAESISPSASA
jgi:hypothetical protein